MGEAAQSRQNAEADKKTVGEKEAAALAAAQAKIVNDGKLAQDRKRLQESRENQANAEKQLAELKGLFGLHYTPAFLPQTGIQYPVWKAAHDIIETENARQPRLQKAIEQEQGKQKGLELNASLARNDAEFARKAYENAKKDAEEQRRKIESLQTELNDAKIKVATLEKLHNETAEIRAKIEQLDAAQKGRLAAAGSSSESNDIRFVLLDVQRGVHAIQAESQNLLSQIIELSRELRANVPTRVQYEELARQVQETRNQIAFNRYTC